VPGFEFRYRLGGGQPTIRSFVFKNTETLARGDMLSYSNGRLVLAACGDTTLVGSVTDTIASEFTVVLDSTSARRTACDSLPVAI
jgi:hypothetical protein